jgi:ABC-type ATPase with predicted acetyltransferase domain
MPTYSVSKSFKWHGTVTDKVALVCRMFGLSIDRLTERKVSYSCQIQINTGDIVYISGPSGAGKSVLLKELEKSIPPSDRVNLDRIKLPDDKTLIDCIDGDLLDSLKMLSTAGLNDCFCILNQPQNLSDGQKYRFRLAMALAANKQFIFADEFTSELDRITAAVISYNLYTFAKRTGRIFILASCHNDILLDLSPDVLVTTALSGTTEVTYKRARR